ncbi:F-box domain-containing protein [Caenorhabditis elegans]|uniref:F-box domain-containing protein n=1 Tax=Caenorhabditis elegans TaxID=6239 RepID=A3KFD5_CAEEL|nr:F-box domain-containing protein [Caenorhabditis elegans]CCD74442.2 F-box domain-containing protein [Caenorhabditis elegans]
MTESVLENPIFIRSCILNEVLHRKPIRESYKNFCEKLGDDVMDYIDFEFWFYRFYEGNHDLNYDQKLEPKNLSDMPIKILQRILNELCFRDKMVLQKVCRILRKVVPEIDAAAHSAVSFRMCRDWTFLEFSKHEIVYREFEGGCIVKYEDYAKPVIGGNQLELALNDFSNFLKCPKLHLKHFGVTFSSAVGEEARQEVIETVGTLKWPNLKTVFFNGIHQSEIKPMITCFNSETIEHIILDVSRDSTSRQFPYQLAKGDFPKLNHGPH